MLTVSSMRAEFLFTALEQSLTYTHTKSFFMFLSPPKMLLDVWVSAPGTLGGALTKKGKQGLECKVHGSSTGLFPGFQDYFLLADFTEIET